MPLQGIRDFFSRTVSQPIANAAGKAQQFAADHPRIAKAAKFGAAALAVGVAGYYAATAAAACFNPAPVCSMVEESIPATLTFLQRWGMEKAPEAAKRAVEQCVEAAPTICQNGISAAQSAATTAMEYLAIAGSLFAGFKLLRNRNKSKPVSIPAPTALTTPASAAANAVPPAAAASSAPATAVLAAAPAPSAPAAASRQVVARNGKKELASHLEELVKRGAAIRPVRVDGRIQLVAILPKTPGVLDNIVTIDPRAYGVSIHPPKGTSFLPLSALEDQQRAALSRKSIAQLLPNTDAEDFFAAPAALFIPHGMTKEAWDACDPFAQEAINPFEENAPPSEPRTDAAVGIDWEAVFNEEAAPSGSAPVDGGASVDFWAAQSVQHDGPFDFGADATVPMAAPAPATPEAPAAAAANRLSPVQEVDENQFN